MPTIKYDNTFNNCYDNWVNDPCTRQLNRHSSNKLLLLLITVHLQ